jgi:hypothetical protein
VEFTWNINDRLLQSEVDSREVASVLSKDTEETTGSVTEEQLMS